MTHRTDDKFNALRAQGFTGSVAEMTLAWLQAAGATSDHITDAWYEMLEIKVPVPTRTNIYLNDRLQGGAPSGPIDGANPPDNHSIGFNSVDSGPHSSGWEMNAAEDTGRCYLSYAMGDNNPDLTVGTYRLFVDMEVLAGATQPMLLLSALTNAVMGDSDRQVPVGTRKVVWMDIEITDTPYTAELRIGVGASNNRSEHAIIYTPALLHDMSEAVPRYGRQRNDLWYEYLGASGYVGSINEREAAFWADGGALAPPIPLVDWTIEQSGDLYGYGPGYGGLVPDSNGVVTVVRLDVDSVSDVVTLEFDVAPEWESIVIAAENIGVTTVTRVGPDTLYQTTDAVFTAAVVAEDGNTNPVRALPAGVVQPPIWGTNIPSELLGTAGAAFNYNAAQHIAFNPYFPVTDYSIATGEIAGSSIDSAGLFTLADTVAPGIHPFSLTADNIVGTSDPSNVFTVELRTDPVIDTQPDDANIEEPLGTFFEVEASHPYEDELFYEWTTSRELNTGPTDQATLNVTSTSVADSGTQVFVDVRAYSPVSGFLVTSATVTLTVTAGELFPPVIDVQPENLTVTEPEGGRFVLEASHPEDALLYYQWQTLDLTQPAWIDAGDFLITPNDTLATLTLTETAAIHDGFYVRGRVRAYNSANNEQEVYTDLALLRVLEDPKFPPVIVTQPVDLDVIVPEEGTFTVVASHPDGDDVLLYQWEHSFISVSGAETATLTLNSTSLQEDGLQTRCRVRAYDNSGDFQVFTEFATLNATAGLVPPTITEQPESLVLVTPDGGEMSVVATHQDGPSALFYLWQCISSSDGITWVSVQATDGLSNVAEGTENEDMMVIDDSEVEDTRDVRVIVYAYDLGNPNQEISDEVRLEVTDDFEPVWDFVPDEFIYWENLPIAVDMNQFILQGEDLTDWLLTGEPAGVTIDENGVIDATTDTPIGAFTMTCAVENDLGSDTTNPFTWTVAGFDALITQEPEDLFVVEPEGGEFEVVAEHPTGAPLFHRWEAWDVIGEEWVSPDLVLSDVDLSSITASVLVLDSTTLDDPDPPPDGITEFDQVPNLHSYWGGEDSTIETSVNDVISVRAGYGLYPSLELLPLGTVLYDGVGIRIENMLALRAGSTVGQQDGLHLDFPIDQGGNHFDPTDGMTIIITELRDYTDSGDCSFELLADDTSRYLKLSRSGSDTYQVEEGANPAQDTGVAISIEDRTTIAISLTGDIADSMSVYVNGQVLAGPFTYSARADLIDEMVWMNAATPAAIENIQGKGCIFLIYNRELTAQEIEDIYDLCQFKSRYGIGWDNRWPIP